MMTRFPIKMTFLLLLPCAPASAGFTIGPEVGQLVEGRLKVSEASLHSYSNVRDESTRLQNIQDKSYGSNSIGLRLAVEGEAGAVGLRLNPMQDFSASDRSLKGSASTLFMDLNLGACDDSCFYAMLAFQQQTLELSLKSSAQYEEVKFSTLNLINAQYGLGFKSEMNGLQLGFEYRLTRNFQSADARSSISENYFYGTAELQNVRFETDELLLTVGLN